MDIDPSPIPEQAAPQQFPRRSTRTSHPPVWMKDYVGHISVSTSVALSSGVTPPTFPYVINPHISQPHISYLFNLTMVTEPTSYKEACKHIEWIQAMNLELDALVNNNTWELTDLPPATRPIGCKWVYKVKLKSDGTVERCKARLVAKGYNQELGIDYTEVFSPVANLVSVRVFKPLLQLIVGVFIR